MSEIEKTGAVSLSLSRFRGAVPEGGAGTVRACVDRDHPVHLHAPSPADAAGSHREAVGNPFRNLSGRAKINFAHNSHTKAETAEKIPAVLVL